MGDLQERMQALVDGLCSLDTDSGVTVITSVLQARPEMATPVVAFAVPDLTFPPSKALIERRAEGVIKSFNAEKGFGFIDCQELKEAFGNDVFFHHSQLGEFGPGQHVSFAVMLNKEMKPQAYDLQSGKGAGKGAKGGGWADAWGGKGWAAPAAAAAPMMAPVKGKGAWGAKGTGGGAKGTGGGASGPGGGKGPMAAGGCKGKGKAPGKSEAKGDEQPLGQQAGVIKSFNDKNAYGFIACPEVSAEFGGDVFLHASDKGDFNVGDAVVFEAFLNSMGKPQARALQYGDGAPAAKRPRTVAATWGKGKW